MNSNYFCKDFDEIFENETNDELFNEDCLPWSCDLLNLNSEEFNFDPLLDDTLYNNLIDKSKSKTSDFDTSLTDFNDLLKEESECQHIKVEPTNSVSSTYLTDESSHPSSINSSPVSEKVRKRDYKSLDSNSEQDLVELPTKTTKYEIIKTSISNTKIYKLTKDIKVEPIYINSVTIRHPGSNSAPYVVHKVPSNIKTVSICPQKLSSEKCVETTNNNFIYSPQQSVADQDQDFLSGDYYDNEVDHYQSRSTGYYQSAYGSSLSQSHSNKNVFQPIPQTGPLFLSDEEKRTLLAEGYSIPTRLPLTKQDERNLKKVRRKIKNKISAQESRRKKKEYLDALEKKMDSYEHERVENKRRIELLENTQRSLYSQIRHLQQQLLSKVPGPGSTTSTGLMLFMLCFTLLLAGGSLPSSYREMNLPQTKLVSSSSLYYMGYGMPRNLFNYSEQTALFRDSSQYKSVKEHSQSLKERGIMPRPSILLGDDHDEKTFEELILSYVKKRQVCEVYLERKVFSRNVVHRNESIHHEDSSRDINVTIMNHVMGNILLEK